MNDFSAALKCLINDPTDISIILHKGMNAFMQRTVIGFWVSTKDSSHHSSISAWPLSLCVQHVCRLFLGDHSFFPNYLWSLSFICGSPFPFIFFFLYSFPLIFYCLQSLPNMMIIYNLFEEMLSSNVHVDKSKHIWILHPVYSFMPCQIIMQPTHS